MKEADQYNGFNLILVDVRSKSMIYLTNRPEKTGNFVTQVSPGVHVLSNANLDSPWLKVRRFFMFVIFHSYSLVDLGIVLYLALHS